MQHLDREDDLISTLLKPADLSTKAPAERALSSRAKSEAARLAALKALRHWGHMRCAELARVVYPHARHGEQLAQRLMQRLADDRGEVVVRQNALGTRSFVLSRGGAAALEAMGFETRHGLDLSSVAGSTFLHRTLATRFGIERELSGFTSYGEHAIAQGFGPLSREALIRHYGKLPDLLLVKGNAVTWCEVESAAKPTAELQACCRISEFVGGPLIPFGKLHLQGLTFVFDASQGHAQRIARAGELQWRARARHERERFMQRIELVHVELQPPARWCGMREVPLWPGRPVLGTGIKPAATPERSLPQLAK